MKIRKLKIEDIPALATIVWNNYHSKAWQKSVQVDLKEMFSKGPYRPTYFVAEDGGKPVGFAGCMQSWMDNDVYHIFWVNVDPAEQKRGIGKMLVAACIAFAQKQNGLLILLTTDAPQYYEHNFGFKSLQPLHREAYTLMSLSLEKE